MSFRIYVVWVFKTSKLEKLNLIGLARENDHFYTNKKKFCLKNVEIFFYCVEKFFYYVFILQKEIFSEKFLIIFE